MAANDESEPHSLETAANNESEPHSQKWLQMVKVSVTRKNGCKW